MESEDEKISPETVVEEKKKETTKPEVVPETVVEIIEKISEKYDSPKEEKVNSLLP